MINKTNSPFDTHIDSELSGWISDTTKTGNKEEAIKRIRKAFEENAPVLDLSCLNLNWIPTCISQLKLKYLSLCVNNLEKLPEELVHLSELQILSLDYNKKLTTLPVSLGNISSLKVITTGESGVSVTESKKILESCANLAFQEKLIKKESTFTKEKLLFSDRPTEVQEEIDRIHSKLVKGTAWLHDGNKGLYNLLGFVDTEVIDQRISKAAKNKKDLYFIDLGSGHFSWVNSVHSHLRQKYKDDPRQFHVIGVTGEGEPYEYKKVDGNIIIHKIHGFKLENLIETFETKFDLHLVNSVEMMTASWVLQHLVDPLGCLDQAWHLLSPGNGMLFATGFDGLCPNQGKNSLGATLGKAFGLDSYIAQRTDSKPDSFALFRDKDSFGSFTKKSFRYDQIKPVLYYDESGDCFAHCNANLKLTSYDEVFPDEDWGGQIHGASTYVLEQLLGHDDKEIETDRVYGIPIVKKMKLFNNLKFLKEYLNSYQYKCG